MSEAMSFAHEPRILNIFQLYSLLFYSRGIKVVPQHGPHKTLKSNFTENDITTKSPFQTHAC